MKKPRITGHQLQYMFGMRNFADGREDKFSRAVNPKSWINDKGDRVWNFHSMSKHLNVLGDPWDTVTGESLLKKGIIEPSFSMTHDGGHDAPDGHYRYARGKEIQFYRMTELGYSCLI